MQQLSAPLALSPAFRVSRSRRQLGSGRKGRQLRRCCWHVLNGRHLTPSLRLSRPTAAVKPSTCWLSGEGLAFLNARFFVSSLPVVLHSYNELIRETAPGISSKTLFLPYQTEALSGLVASLPQVYGRHSAPVAASVAAATTAERIEPPVRSEIRHPTPKSVAVLAREGDRAVTRAPQFAELD